MREPYWYEAPLCAEIGGDWWFIDKDDNNINASLPKSVCGRCEHRVECAEWGIQNEEYGIWGGLTPRQRQKIRTERRKLGQKKSA